MDENNQMNEQQMGENPQADVTPEQQAPNAEQSQQYGEQAMANQQMYEQYAGQQYQQAYDGQGMPNGGYQQYDAQGMSNQQMYGGGYQQYGAQGMPAGGYQQYGAQGMPNGGYQQYGAQGMPAGQYQQYYGAQGMPNGQYQQYGTQTAAQKPKNSSNTASEVIEGITGLVTAPHDTMKKLTSKENIAVGSIFIAIQAVVAFLLVLFSFLILGTRSCYTSAVGNAFYALFFVLIIDFIAAGMLVLMGNTILKGNLTFGKAVNVVGIFAIFQTVADILAVIFILIGGLADVHFFISVGYIFFAGVTLLALVFGIDAALTACELGENVKVYVVGVALILTVLLGVAVDNIGEKIFEDQNVSAYKICYIMEHADSVKELDEEMKETYENYYEDEYDSYSEFLKKYEYRNYYNIFRYIY